MRAVIVAVTLIAVGGVIAAAYLFRDAPQPPPSRSTPAAATVAAECDPRRDRPTGAELKAMTDGELEALRWQTEACLAALTGQEPPAKEAARPQGRWRAETSKSEFTDRMNAWAWVDAREAVRIKHYGDMVRPRLYIRCHDNTTALFVDFAGFITTREARVRYRIGNEQARTATWRMSTDYKMAGLWRGGQAIPFIKTLFGQDRFLIETVPHGEGPVTVEFDIGGIENAAATIRHHCGW